VPNKKTKHQTQNFALLFLAGVVVVTMSIAAIGQWYSATSFEAQGGGVQKSIHHGR
jgi:hypothetical protein